MARRVSVYLLSSATGVLARLDERNLTQTPLGTAAITCAAVDDVRVWSILAFVVAITTAGGAMETWLAIVTLSVLFVLLMTFTMIVLIALVTTAMTGPLVSLSLNWGRLPRQHQPAS